MAIDRPEVPKRSGERADTLRLLLLDLISDRRDVSPESVAALDAAAWRAMLDMVRQHRLGGLLHWQLERRHAALPIPDAVRAELHEAWRTATRRMLGMCYELSTLSKLLAAAGIRSVALKGPFLAYHAYPQPALRPMRDLDILVPEDRLMDAWHALIAAGAQPALGGDGDLRVRHAIRVDKHHLPALLSPSGFSKLELHRGVQSAESAKDCDRNILLLDSVWANACEHSIGTTSIAFPRPTDMLLHLIMHAAYDHLLNNGPLVLADIAFLLRGHAVDWNRFWHMAEELRSMRGAVLLLDLAADYWRDLPIVWTPAAVDLRTRIEAIRVSAALLLLQDRELTPDIWRNRGRSRGAVRQLLGRLFISREEMGLLYPTAARSRRILLRYPARWWWLATRRIPEARRMGRRTDLRHQAAIDAAVSRWLRA
ncbi:MAG TPA: nucleotidyltransferase family protein [Sphingomonas sp.]|nr:nucleotidyltransferase family protein [Sphingomonas sp.]